MLEQRQPYPPDVREEAFDLHVSGFNRRQILARLRDRHGAAAPSESTLKRWALQDHWTARRARIRSLSRSHDDDQRALVGTRMTGELLNIRRLAVEAAQDLPFSSAEGALFALAALERIIDRHEVRLVEQHYRDRFHFALGLAGPYGPVFSRQGAPEGDPLPPGPGSPSPSEEVTQTWPKDDPSANPSSAPRTRSGRDE
ncbi:MAG: hypothetical protein IH971_08565 [Candidatus Marinimicrobia bacterium]|nr:hypothetical protein [Candidatus Neomarinimicrobiota bacterium]